MNIFITGSGGFLGKALTAALTQQGRHRVVSPRSGACDLTDAAALRDLAHPRYDRIFHLAAWTQAGDFCLHHPGEQWIVNQRIHTNVLSWWRETQPQAKLIAIGTSCAYDEQLPLTEENYLRGQPTPSLLTYAMTKRMLLVGLEALRRQFGLEYLHVVPSTLYGPNYHQDGRQMHFIFDLIRKLLRGQHLGEPVVLWGDGHQTRELVFVDDFVRILLDLVERRANETINIGAGASFSIRDFARAICGIVGYDFERIEFDTSRYVGVRSKCLDNSRLRALLPDARFTPLETGLRATIAWMAARGFALTVNAKRSVPSARSEREAASGIN
jgi:GDP-L-fucose synthase